MNKERFDHLFDESFDKLVNKKSDEYSSNYKPSWNKVKKQLKFIENKERKRNRKTFLRNISVIFLSMIIGAFVFGNITETKAFNPFYQTLKEMPGEIASLFFGNKNNGQGDAKTDPPSNRITDKDLELTDKVVSVDTIDESQNKSSFQIPSFKYIPGDYKFKNADLFMLDGDNLARKVRLTFSNKEKSFWVSLYLLESDTTVGSGSKNSNIKEIQLKNGKGYLTISEDGSSKLEFLRGNVYVSVLGDLPQEELIRFADDM